MKWTTKKTLVLAFGTWLLLYGTAGAVDCSDDPPTLVLGRPVTNPEPVDRQDIMDLIHSYSWTLDDKDPQGFEELFTEDGVYEACNAGGLTQIFRVTSKAEARQRIEMQFADLRTRAIQTRHFPTNTILNVIDKEKNTVEEKTTMLVTIQRGDETAAPEIDYTAVLKGLIVKDGNVWRFKKLTLFTDLPQIITKAR